MIWNLIQTLLSYNFKWDEKTPGNNWIVIPVAWVDAKKQWDQL